MAVLCSMRPLSAETRGQFFPRDTAFVRRVMSLGALRGRTSGH